MEIVKKTIGIAAAGAILTAFAGSSFAVSENANQQACFGQGRATYATTGPETVGFHASQRKGTNAELNAAYREACQATDNGGE